ncbi:MAG: glycosyltransferase family 2 protein [Proteobacteria bacterium]|nr:glycosyltransferase family 2 protein [Pseudomonadota bacterium]
MESLSEIELSIVAPMYNEAENIETTINRLTNAMKDFPGQWEMIFVNDGSTDQTLEIARVWEQKIDNLIIASYPVNMGRGRALRTGFKKARGKYIVSTDFDLSYSPDHILRIYKELCDPCQMNDIVLGSAYMPGGKTKGVSALRLFISKTGNNILQFAFPKKVYTSTCILRGYKREALQSLEFESDRKEIHLEILSKAFATGLTIKEIPATLESRKQGKSKFRFRHTAFTHILFSLFEKPIFVFGAIGGSLSLAGFFIGLYIIWERFSGSLSAERPLIPLMILLLVVGTQFLCFAFIASQNIFLRNEMFRLQRQMNIMKNNHGKN